MSEEVAKRESVDLGEQPESTETTVADVKVESAEPAAAATADDAAATKSEDAGEEAGEDAKKKPAWVQSLEDTIINPLKEGTEKVAQETKHAFEEAGKKIDESIAKSKEPGGVFAKETYVAMGDKIKQAFEGVGSKIRSLSGSAPAETDEAAMDAAAEESAEAATAEAAATTETAETPESTEETV
mmetsp:Transcript_45108/g.66375  ORF Transcript_45108/g.66375 Transcript_45108/m.66375 type:complete len:185 (+) Transcript_45108:87-641(+)|eukprot:CAMPEP_0195516026 /NCGR_PEP_ID=MMETSP0794_2-20130614/6890_1 /TAXON_ID=515487 /ORGANISM="Stephanopyxis turris, Strain CCMP 815" /LENGTH=184 /DNA_ID=CAMNT_0040644537 /DNA_START=87 /DNA_END=641 /DNA_ORIENTATION=+